MSQHKVTAHHQLHWINNLNETLPTELVIMPWITSPSIYHEQLFSYAITWILSLTLMSITSLHWERSMGVWSEIISHRDIICLKYHSGDIIWNVNTLPLVDGCIGEIKSCGLAGGSLSIGADFEVSKDLCHPYCASCILFEAWDVRSQQIQPPRLHLVIMSINPLEL